MLRTQQNLCDTYLAIERSTARIASLCASVARADEEIRKSRALVETKVRRAPVLTGSKPNDHEAQLRIAARLVEALRAAGYGCKLSAGVTLQ